MRGIHRSPSPRRVNLRPYQQTNSTWSALAGGQTTQSKNDYDALRKSLLEEFNGLCAYCERQVRRRRGEPGPIDHFRPRNPDTGSQASHFGADLTFDWRNLVYSCSVCQTRKANKWPGTLALWKEAAIDQTLDSMAHANGWTYTPVPVAEGYVDPSYAVGMSAEDYFEYDELDASITPSRALNEEQRSRALRTILDIGLDDGSISQDRHGHIQAIKTYVKSKGTQRATQEISRLVNRHQRRSRNDTKESAFGPAVRFTGLVLFASANGWFT